MPGKTLLNYIKQQLARGYDTQTIKQYLLRYGYNPSDVDEAIRQVYSPEVKHIIHFSPTTLISITIIFVSLIAASFFFYNFFSSKAPETLLDLNLEAVKATANAGSQISFIAELDSLGSSKRYDVNLKYEIIDSKTSKVVTFKEETRAIETKSSKQIEIQIPLGAAKGDYILRAVAVYNGQRAVATLPVKISEEITEQEPVEQEPITQKPIEEPEEEIIKPETEVPESTEDEAAGSDALTTFETLEKVEAIAKEDKKEAENLCRKLELQTSKDLCFNKIGEVLGDRSYCTLVSDERTKDVCLSNVAKIVDKSEICQEIAKESRKDSCYMNFVVDKKDYTVCDKVINQYLRQSCESLKQLSQLNITDVAFYESLINQSLVQLT